MGLSVLPPSRRDAINVQGVNRWLDCLRIIGFVLRRGVALLDTAFGNEGHHDVLPKLQGQDQRLLMHEASCQRLTAREDQAGLRETLYDEGRRRLGGSFRQQVAADTGGWRLKRCGT